MVLLVADLTSVRMMMMASNIDNMVIIELK